MSQDSCWRIHERMNDGWACDAPPGAPVTLTKDGRTIAPFIAIAELKRGELTRETWAEQCEAAGIAERALGDSVRDATVRTRGYG